MNLLKDGELTMLVKQISKIEFQKDFIDEVRFNNRLRTTGGRYIPRKRLIELNPKYYLESSMEEFIGIIKHELCHYHLHIEGKGFNHGDSEFKELLKKTGSPRYCQPLDSQVISKYKYRCESCSTIYERVRRVNVTRYSCGKCRGRLKLM